MSESNDSALGKANEIVAAEFIKIAHRRGEWIRLRQALLDDALISAVARDLAEILPGDTDEGDALVLLAISSAVDKLGPEGPEWFMAKQ